MTTSDFSVRCQKSSCLYPIYIWNLVLRSKPPPKSILKWPPPPNSNVQGGRMHIPIFSGKGYFWAWKGGVFKAISRDMGYFSEASREIKNRGYDSYVCFPSPQHCPTLFWMAFCLLPLLPSCHYFHCLQLFIYYPTSYRSSFRQAYDRNDPAYLPFKVVVK